MDILDHALAQAASELPRGEFERLLEQIAPWYREDPAGWAGRLAALPSLRSDRRGEALQPDHLVSESVSRDRHASIFLCARSK
jgi:hypothetical protein